MSDQIGESYDPYGELVFRRGTHCLHPKQDFVATALHRLSRLSADVERLHELIAYPPGPERTLEVPRQDVDRVVGPRDSDDDDDGIPWQHRVRFMIGRSESGERFSLVEHPMSPHGLQMDPGGVPGLVDRFGVQFPGEPI